MQNKIFLFGFILFFVICVHYLQAQNTLLVKEKSGVKSPYPLTNIKTLTFVSGSITVNQKDGNTNSYALKKIRYLNFGNDGTTGISPIGIEGNNTLILYPNPVTDHLNVQFTSSMVGKVQFQIIDMQGCIILEESVGSQPGINYGTISVSQLHHGIYFCRMQNGNKLENHKFLKN